MRQAHIYLAIKESKEEYGYPVELSCGLFGVSRAAYYRWLSGKKCARELENEKIEDYIAYYNNRRVQRNLGVLTPMEKHCSYPLAA